MVFLWLLCQCWATPEGFIETMRVRDDHTTLVLRGMRPGDWSPEQLRTWHHYAGNPVLVPEAPYELWMGGGNLYAPAILRREGRYWMFYGAQNPEGHDQIHLAFSEDGIRWTRYEGNPILPAGDANHVNDPTIVEVDGTFYLYYSLAPTAEQDRIHLATSEDGLHWRPQGEVLGPGPMGSWDSLKVGRPSVLYEYGRFLLWFDGTEADPEHPERIRPGTGRHVGIAYSDDGFHFEKSPEPLYRHAGAVDGAHVEEIYVLLMEGRDGTHWALGSTPDKLQDRGLLLPLSGEPYDRYGQVTPMILQESGRWTAIYYGAAEGLPEPGPANWNRNRIGVAFPQRRVRLLDSSGETLPIRCRALDRDRLEVQVAGDVAGCVLQIFEVDGETLLREIPL